MPNRRTRERQLAKLAARRQAERRKKRRRRIFAAIVGIAVAAAGLGVLGFALFSGPKTKTQAKGTPTPTPSATSSAAPGAVACGGKVPAAASKKKPSFSKPPAMTIDDSKTYTATVVTSCGTIVIKLDPKQAPNTVNSVVFLAKKHFYDGLVFPRIARNFVIQGGDPTGTGSGGPGYQTVDAPPADAKYTAGVVAMAKTGSEAAGTSGSQFFIVTAPDAALPAQYAIVGTVTKGQDIADKIGALPIKDGATDGEPTQTVYIEKITISVS
jgi:peptidyl-prolyl cis-trans isomerase B (cyclophilin B)